VPKDKKPRTADALDSHKKSEMFRFPADTAKMLSIASKQAAMTKTGYVMLALKHQFQADGLLPPDPSFAPARKR
jgi:hypothetical protein